MGKASNQKKKRRQGTGDRLDQGEPGPPATARRARGPRADEPTVVCCQRPSFCPRWWPG